MRRSVVSRLIKLSLNCLGCETGKELDMQGTTYDEQVRAGGFFAHVLPPLLDLVGESEGQHICDLACGQGQVALPLAARGA